MTSQQNDGSANNDNGAIIMKNQQPLLLPQPSLQSSSSQPMPIPIPMPIAPQPIAPNNMTTTPPMSSMMMSSMHQQQPMIHPYQYQQQLAAQHQHQQELQQLRPNHHQQQQQQQQYAAINPVNVHSGKLPLSIPNAPAATRGGGVGPGGTTGGGPGVVGGQLLQFPWKLHQMLRLAEQNCQSDIISWLPGGNGFKVYKKDRFCAEIMPGYFASQKYKTFQRSLNLWGFESVAKGPSRGACYHQFFVKGHPELCHSMYVFKTNKKETKIPLAFKFYNRRSRFVLHVILSSLVFYYYYFYFFSFLSFDYRTRVKIKGQSHPRTPAAALAAANAAAEKAAIVAAYGLSASNRQQQQGTTTMAMAMTRGGGGGGGTGVLLAPNMINNYDGGGAATAVGNTMNGTTTVVNNNRHHPQQQQLLSIAPAGGGGGGGDIQQQVVGMQMNPTAMANYNAAMQNFVAMNALHQLNPAAAAAALSNPAMNAMIAAQVMAASSAAMSASTSTPNNVNTNILNNSGLSPIPIAASAVPNPAAFVPSVMTTTTNRMTTPGGVVEIAPAGPYSNNNIQGNSTAGGTTSSFTPIAMAAVEPTPIASMAPTAAPITIQTTTAAPTPTTECSPATLAQEEETITAV